MSNVRFYWASVLYFNVFCLFVCLFRKIKNDKIVKIIEFQAILQHSRGSNFRIFPNWGLYQGGNSPPLVPNPPSCMKTRPPTPPTRQRKAFFFQKTQFDLVKSTPPPPPQGGGSLKVQKWQFFVIFSLFDGFRVFNKVYHNIV